MHFNVTQKNSYFIGRVTYTMQYENKIRMFSGRSIEPTPIDYQGVPDLKIAKVQ